MSQPATELAEPGQLTQYRDGDAGLMLAAAEATVRAYCGWHIAPVRADDVVTVDGSGATVLALPTMNLRDVSEVTEDGQLVTLDTVSWSASGFLHRTAPWTTRLRGVVVTMEHGYADVPLEVQAVVLAVAARAVVSPDGVVRSQVGSVSVTFSQSSFNVAGGVALLEHERGVLDRYRLPSTP